MDRENASPKVVENLRMALRAEFRLLAELFREHEESLARGVDGSTRHVARDL